MKIPLQVMNTYKYKRTVPSYSFLFVCICTFSTVTLSCMKALMWTRSERTNFVRRLAVGAHRGFSMTRVVGVLD